MQIQKEIVLFCSLLTLFLGVLAAANLPPSPDKKCKKQSGCIRKTGTPHPNATPWNFITEGMLHIA